MSNQFIVRDSIKAFGLEFELCDVVNEATQYEESIPVKNYRRALVVSKHQEGWTIYLDGEEWADIDAARLAGFLMKSRIDKNKYYNIKPKNKIHAAAVKPVEGDIEPPPKQRVKTSFTFRDRTARNVLLFGDFNDWKEGIALVPDRGGIWRITLELEMGRYEYKFMVDKEWRLDPNNPDKAHGDHGANSVIRVWEDPVREELGENEMLSRFMRRD